MLSGSEKNRVKTVKLRGNISQGIVCAPATLAANCPDLNTVQAGDDVTTLLGVEKYDPPPIPTQYADLKPLPAFVNKYDIEGAQNYSDIADTLMDTAVFITEKLEGSHWSITWLSDDDRIVVSQRNYRLEPNDDGEHTWHKIAKRDGYPDKVRAIAEDIKTKTGSAPQAVTIRGELIGPGIQKNYYRLKDHTVYVFEVEVNSTPIDAKLLLDYAKRFDLPHVPILAQDITLREWLVGKTLKQASDGRSKLADKRREGIVIKPMVEQRTPEFGRVILKQRSPDYLSKSEF